MRISIKTTLLGLVIASCLPIHTQAQSDEEILKELATWMRFIPVDSLERHAALFFSDAGMDHMGYAATGDYVLIQASKRHDHYPFPPTWSMLLKDGKVRLLTYAYATDQYMGSCGHQQLTNYYKWKNREAVHESTVSDPAFCTWYIHHHEAGKEETSLLRYLADSHEMMGFAYFYYMYFNGDCVNTPIPNNFSLDGYTLEWIHPIPGEPERITEDSKQKSYREYSQLMTRAGMLRRQEFCNDGNSLMINILYPPDQETSIVHTLSLYYTRTE